MNWLFSLSVSLGSTLCQQSKDRKLLSNHQGLFISSLHWMLSGTCCKHVISHLNISISIADSITSVDENVLLSQIFSEPFLKAQCILFMHTCRMLHSQITSLNCVIQLIGTFSSLPAIAFYLNQVQTVFKLCLNVCKIFHL